MKTRFFVPVLPSVTEELAMDKLGTVSSLLIVPVAEAVPIVALTGLVNVNVMFSSVSNNVSPVIRTVTVPVVEPAGMVRVAADIAVKSLPPDAVLFDVAYPTVTFLLEEVARATVKTRLVVPASPSVTDDDEIDRTGNAGDDPLPPQPVKDRIIAIVML